MNRLDHISKILIVMMCLPFGNAFAQEEDKEEIIAKANQFIASGNNLLIEEANFPKAEGEYRKAIAKNPVDPTAKYNLANAYYGTKKYDEANQRYKEAVKVADSKTAKHKAFHNQGNTFMEQKKYKEAVEAYKNALRNNPKDDETRYNLALAKKMLEQEQKNGGGDDDKENKDNKDDQGNKDKKEGDNKENKDDKKEGEDKKEEGDKGENKEDKKEGEDKKDDQGDPKDEKEEGKKGEGEDKKEDQGKPGDQQQQQPKQMQGQLSPQQVKSLLQAMNNEEKKVQGKINEKKAQGAKTRSEKDW